ncbi:DNA binding domain protein, excisionase family [Hydrogenobacter thermophilus TK-6]|uniref:Site-specific integrase-resolvase n=1 Tax=Hydrogenobacter thermophilus (strain DSM 6534 / IAM 12695 / TK-6) TaxID=608538 RepID=D3DHN5_HYDTT|nr:IS607 family transposase [Hydrogenobacter thermophilus]ADO45274.1 DNA binding domain protein, excisionase family [Hydrogenobacter thermophilus TK-6]BAI69337.1 site-specific integrase-resolvase [Hydrogenobacter thermophilus TK-6]
MNRRLRIGEASRVLGVSVSTLRRWEREGKLKPYRVGKERRYSYEQLMELLGEKRADAVAIYARVSSRDQKKDLERQLEYLRKCVEGKHQKVYEVKDIASGIKEGRKGLLKLIELARLRKIRAIYITYPDRLTRFGFDYFVEFFKALGVEIIAVNGKEFKEPEKELVEDLIAILTSFAGKLYGMRANKIKKMVKELRDEG